MSRPSNRRSTLTFALGVAALVLATTGVAYGVGDTATHFRSLVLYERGTSFTPLDLGATGPSPGDTVTFTSDLFSDAGFKSKVGTVVGTCTVVDVKAAIAECGATARLADGDIQVNGPVPTESESFTAPVTGGTGRYRTVGGELQSTQLNASGDTKDVFTLLR
jgi:hypothetical protein